MKFIRMISNVGTVDGIFKIVEDEVSEGPPGNLVVQLAFHEFNLFTGHPRDP